MDLREKIIGSSNANFLNRAKPEVIQELISITSFLPEDYGNSIRYWYIKNELTSIVKCKCCDSEPKFHGISKGYSLYCSTLCRNKDTKTRHELNLEIKKIEDEKKLIDSPDQFIKCEICGSAIKLLKNHLLNSHKNWTFDQYKKEFPGADTIAKSTSLKNSENNKGDKNIFSKSKSTEIERKQRSIFSLESWKKKYPEKSEEELIQMRNIELRDKLKDRKLPSQIEYWTNKGFVEEEAKEKVIESQRTFTLEKCIEKYGEVEGLLKFQERQKKWTHSLYANFEKYGDGRSIQSKWASDIINSLCKGLKIKRPKKEKWISSKDRKLKCSYDFTYKNKIIEFNGDLWHANPLMYDKNFIIPKCNITASDKWKIDEEKIELAKSNGYEILVIWESEFKENPQKIINECISFLNS